MRKILEAVKRELKKSDVIEEITTEMEDRIKYFKDLDGDKDDMESMFRADHKKHIEIIEAIYDDKVPFDKVEEMFYHQDTAPRETLYCILENMISFDAYLFDNCTAIDSVKRVMIDKGYDFKEEYFANVGVIHLTFSKGEYSKTSTFHKTNYTKANVQDFCLDILNENK